MKRILVSLLLLTAVGCQKEECEKGAKLRENLGQLEFSLRGALAEPEGLKELCTWIRDRENPYLRLSALELITLSGRTQSEEIKQAAGELSSALVSDFGIAHNIGSMCGSYFSKGYTTDTQFYIRDTINQIRSPLSQGSARKLMVAGGCSQD